MIPQNAWYDWGGLNVWLFHQINAIHGGVYDSAMLTLTHIADYHNFPYYLGGLFAIALVSLVMRSVTQRGTVSLHAGMWVGVFAVLLAGFAVEAAVVKAGKEYFAYPRPYLVLEHVRVLEYKPGHEDDHHSFPSGHTAFATMLVMGLWPVIPEVLAWLGPLFIFGVAWSRIALGMHFPADVLASVLIMAPLMLLVRAFIRSLLFNLFKIRC